MLLKWHHIDKCKKNCKIVNILTSILDRLSSSTPYRLPTHVVLNKVITPSNINHFLRKGDKLLEETIYFHLHASTQRGTPQNLQTSVHAIIPRSK